MKTLLKAFIQNDEGAVTIDWVVLTAAVVGLATAAYIGLESATLSLSNVAANKVTLEQTK